MNVNEIYKAIAENLIDSINEDWKSATLHIQASNNHAKTHGEFESNNGEVKSIDVHTFDKMVNFNIMKLHEITTKGNSNRWNRAIFKLWTNNKFDMEFIWDQDLDNEIKALKNK